MDFKDIRFSIGALIFGPIWYAWRRCSAFGFMMLCISIVFGALFSLITPVLYMVGYLLCHVFHALYGLQLAEKIVDNNRTALEDKGLDDDIVEKKTTPSILSAVLFYFLSMIVVMIFLAIMIVVILVIAGPSILNALFTGMMGGLFNG